MVDGKNLPPLSSEEDSVEVPNTVTVEATDLDIRDLNFSTDSVTAYDMYFEIAQGNIPGIKMYSIPGRKDSVSNSVLDDITQVPSTTVVPEPGGIQLELVSDDDEDGDAGLTGILTVMIVYLDALGAEQTEVVTLAGQTPVNTVATDIDFVQWIHAVTNGSVGVAVGNISLRNTAGTVTYSYIAAGGNQSLSGMLKVPVGKKGYVIGWQASAITKKIDIRLRATVMRFDRTLIPGVFLFQDALVLNNESSGWIPFKIPIRMPASAVVKASAIAASTGGDVGVQFDIILVDD